MQEDAHLAIVAELIAKCVLNFGLVASGGACEHVVAHCNANTALQLNLMVIVHTISPAFTTIDSKSCILFVTAIHNIASDKVRHGFSSGRTELIFGSLCWLEQHVSFSVAVQLAGSIGGC